VDLRGCWFDVCAAGGMAFLAAFIYCWAVCVLNERARLNAITVSGRVPRYFITPAAASFIACGFHAHLRTNGRRRLFYILVPARGFSPICICHLVLTNGCRVA